MQANRRRGSLTVVGTGIQVPVQTTPEARTCIEQAEKVVYLVANRASGYWISRLNPTAESLDTLYQQGQDRFVAYQAIVERMLMYVRQELRVCGVFYGHPGVFVYPSHEAIRRARGEGFAARMLPGISAEDCLLADLCVDAGISGHQSFEATDFLAYRRRFDPHSALILWQVGVIGDLTHQRRYEPGGLDLLVEVLQVYYAPDHEIVIYEAAQYPICDPVIARMRLADLPRARVTAISTLYLPPLAPAPPDPAMLRRLGMSGREAASENG
jgi:tetrapyrrole (corrin/porphyrin) methylase-like protein